MDTEIFLLSVLASLIASVIIILMQWISKMRIKRKYSYLLGEWVGLYLIKAGTEIVRQRITIYYNVFFKLRIKIEELSDSNYTYEGKIEIVEDRLFGYLKGLTHEARSNIVMILPFNKKELVPSLIGLFSGITQDKSPAATKILWSRKERALLEIQTLFGHEKPNIVVSKDTDENEARKLDSKYNMR